MTPIPPQERQKIRKCFICGSLAEFECEKDFTLRESICPKCGTRRRYSDLAGIILDTFLPNDNTFLRQAALKLGSLSIYEASTTGPVHDALCGLPHYTCSEFFNNIPMGQKNSEGILCQDLQNLTFSSDYFDLVITQDIFEHIQQPEKAFSEIWRILKPGGFHIFTIPYHEGKPTIRRIIIEDRKEIQRFSPVLHGDSLRAEGALVYTDFGTDIDMMLEKIGFGLELIPCGIWYTPLEIPYILGEKEYQTYLKYYKANDLCRFFKYNSWVFRSKKPENLVT